MENTNFEIGQKIFEQLFALSDNELKEKLISITDGNHMDILTSNCDCIRTIKNSIPQKIEFWYYDGLEVNWFGVHILPEHGSSKTIVNFNSHFKL